MNDLVEVGTITPTAVVKGASTGTKEMRTIGLSLDSTYDMLKLFEETVMRTDEKAGRIAEALEEIAEAVREKPAIDDEPKEILKD